MAFALVHIIFLPVLATFLVGALLVQVFLSKRDSRWPGLILPALAFLLSLTLPLNMAAFHFGGVVALWLLGNIPTLVLLVIYFLCRRGLRED